MKVVATDDDQENTPNSQIFYSIAEQSNSAGMFKINPATGEVFVERNTLDREVTHFSGSDSPYQTMMLFVFPELFIFASWLLST